MALIMEWKPFVGLFCVDTGVEAVICLANCHVHEELIVVGYCFHCKLDC